MQEMIFTVSFRFDGTLAADKTIKFALPFACTLIGVSACATNATNATISVGKSGAAAAALAAILVGVSDTPINKKIADLVGGVPYHYAADAIAWVAIDYDGAGGTAAANLDVVLTFLAG